MTHDEHYYPWYHHRSYHSIDSYDLYQCEIEDHIRGERYEDYPCSLFDFTHSGEKSEIDIEEYIEYQEYSWIGEELSGIYEFLSEEDSRYLWP